MPGRSGDKYGTNDERRSGTVPYQTAGFGRRLPDDIGIQSDFVGDWRSCWLYASFSVSGQRAGTRTINSLEGLGQVVVVELTKI